MYFDSRDIAANTRKWYESFDEKNMSVRVEVFNYVYYDGMKEQLSNEAVKIIQEDGRIEFPMVFKVCPTCDGRGRHVNPSIDGNGITADEWDEWDDNSKEMYLSGGCDVKCYTCDGRRVVPEINTAQLTPAQIEIADYIKECIEEDRRYVLMCLTERYYGA